MAEARGRMPVKPLLIISDAPTAGTGLGRICGDIALRIAENMPEVFRVATFGYGGVVSRHLPYHQYIMEAVKSDWIVPTLPEVWKDWAGQENGIILTIWDLSRLGWLLRPDIQCENPILRDFLLKKPFKTWTYLPIDAEGPQGKLTYPLRETLKGADRVLAYGKWAAGIVDRTRNLSEGTCEYLPHGIDSKVFYERDRRYCRSFFPAITQSFTVTGSSVKPIGNHEIVVGMVCTNQSRKDFGLAIEAFSKIPQVQKRLWIKADSLERYWSIPALLLDFGIEHNTVITQMDLSDDQMAQAYSACDLMFAPGLGEGFGYPISEALFCGTPCVHGNYGGAPEWMESPDMLVDPVAYRYEGVYSCKRPVFSPQDWADKAVSLIDKRCNHNGDIDWVTLWPKWKQWLLEGLE